MTELRSYVPLKLSHSLVLKQLNLRQHKQTTQEQNDVS